MGDLSKSVKTLIMMQTVSLYRMGHGVVKCGRKGFRRKIQAGMKRQRNDGIFSWDKRSAHPVIALCSIPAFITFFLAGLFFRLPGWYNKFFDKPTMIIDIPNKDF